MAVKFDLNSEDWEGLDLELWSVPDLSGGGGGLPGSPFPNVEAVGHVEDGEVSFAAVPPYFAVRLANGATYLRSGVLAAAGLDADSSTGDLRKSYILERAVVVIAAGELSDLLPEVPYFAYTNEEDEEDGKDPDLMITSLDLAISGGELVASGDATYLKSWIGGPVTFSYRFRLEPETSTFAIDRLLEVETDEVEIESDSGGLFGWLENLVVNAVLGYLHEDIAQGLEDTVQATLDEAIAAQLDAEQVPAGTTVTVHKITIDASDGITVDAVAALDLGDLCPTTLTFGSVALRPRDQVDRLRAMRDLALLGTLAGNAYVGIVARFSREVALILARHPDLLKLFDQTIASGLQDFDPRAPGKGVLSPDTARHAEELMKRVAKVGSPRLRDVIERVLPDLGAFVGRTVAEVLAEAEKRPADR